MRKFLFVIASIFISSCTNKVLQETPLQYSFMPSYLNIDSIQSFDLDDTNRVVDSTLDDFQSIAIDGGNLISSDNDTINLPPGILISDRKAMLYPFYKASWERQRKELKYTKYLMSEYYSKAKAAETLYQHEIIKLEKKAKRSWLEKNIGYIGFGAGLVTAIVTTYALFGGVNFIK